MPIYQRLTNTEHGASEKCKVQAIVPYGGHGGNWQRTRGEVAESRTSNKRQQP